MPDISLCKNTSCPKRNSCYRYLAIPGRWQSYTFYPVDGCEKHLSVLKTDHVRLLADVDRENQENGC